jgi:sugar (pentulose or hexulose) kinase
VSGPYVIGLDVGSQGTNGALYDADGTLVASAYETYPLSFPSPGWRSRTLTTGTPPSSAPAAGW